MDFHFKTSETDLKDSWDLVLRIALKICESDLVSAIGSFRLRVDNISLRAPYICGFDALIDTAEEYQFKLMNGITAMENKLAGFFVENEEETNKRKKVRVKGADSDGLECLYFYKKIGYLDRSYHVIDYKLV